jgi:hypothetical protein
MSIDYPHEPITPNNSDPFVSLTISEKNSTVHFLVHDQHFPVDILRKMATRHAQISVREDQKKLSADNLRAAFDIHKCADACLILRSEAELAGLHPVNLAPNELQQCKLYLRSNSLQMTRTEQSPRQMNCHERIDTNNDLFPAGRKPNPNTCSPGPTPKTGSAPASERPNP